MSSSERSYSVSTSKYSEFKWPTHMTRRIKANKFFMTRITEVEWLFHVTCHIFVHKHQFTIYCYQWLIEIKFPSCSLDMYDPLHDHGGVPRHLEPRPVLQHPEAEVTAPGGTLARREGGQTQHSRPVRGQHRVRRTCSIKHSSSFYSPHRSKSIQRAIWALELREH